MMNTLPDSVDALNLSGIMPYDVKSFIKDGKMQTLAPIKNVQHMMAGLNTQDEFLPSNINTNKEEKKKKKLNYKMGILGASLLCLAFTILNKKCPKIGEFSSKISSNISKIFKK